METKKLTRNVSSKVLGGVCSGLGKYFNLDPLLVRIIFIIAALIGSLGIWIYLILWIILPKGN